MSMMYRCDECGTELKADGLYDEARRRVTVSWATENGEAEWSWDLCKRCAGDLLTHNRKDARLTA